MYEKKGDILPHRSYPGYPGLTGIDRGRYSVLAMLVPRRQKFAEEYAKNPHGTNAAIAAGYSSVSAHSSATELLKIPEVQEEIQRQRELIALSKGITKEWVLQRYLEIAQADPRKMTKLKRGPCPACWKERPDLDLMVAMGYEINQDPYPKCKACDGDGVEKVSFTPTDSLTGAEARLFAGVKTTRNGIEYKMRDQDGALKAIADYLGMSKSAIELSGPNGGPISTTPKQMTDDQLLEIANS